MSPAVRTQTADAESAAVPAVMGGIVVRRGLFARLGEAARVTRLSAPAGSGKTFLLRSWIGEGGLADRVAWVSVPGRERDPQRFWISVADALRDTAAGARLVRAVTAEPDLDGWAMVERLLADLGALRDRIWLVIDDVHELTSSEALRQLELLVMRGPAELRFVLATRRDVRLGLHRLRLEGDLTEIRATDLRFTADEARALLEAAGVALPASVLALLHERTEGWAAGLRLAALSLAGHPDPERIAAEFSGSERTVAEYLLAEVLERQPEEVRQLLLRTSLLDQVNGPLADVLRGRSGGEQILQELEQAGTFVVAVDARRSWFRYHPMFADMLRFELRRSAPGELPALHGIAAGWYAEHGHAVEAVRHAQAAQDWSLAARLLSDHMLGLVLDGQGATARELLAGFSASAVPADAELATLLAGHEMTHGSLEAAERQLALATGESASVPADRRDRFEVVLAILRLSVASRRGDLPVVIEQAQRLLAPANAADAPPLVQGAGEDLRTLALVSLGAAELWFLRTEEAERHLEQAVALARRIGRPFLEAGALAHSAWAASFRSFALAVGRSTHATELARRHGWTEEPIVAVAYLALGAIRVWQMRLEEAEPLLDHAERALRAEVQPAAGLVLCQARGMLALARGHQTDALAAFRAAERLAGLLVAEHPAAMLMQAHMLQALVRLGETGLVEQALADLGEEQRERGEMRIAMAALRLAKDDPWAATAALAPVLDGSVPVANRGWVVQAFLLEAIACDAFGDPTAAGQALEHALDLAEPDGVVFPFVLTPPPELLKRQARHTAHAALISEILNLLSPQDQEGLDQGSLGGQAGLGGLGGWHPPRSEGVWGGSWVGPSEGIQPKEPLTDSETRVLRYLPTNLSAPEIAGQLSVSVNTVRTHMRHVYEKLGAHRRAGAVERARALGLLAPSPHRA
jgi:LuxR family transcriptional regulator, maltose regulon positive regulatory protein